MDSLDAGWGTSHRVANDYDQPASSFAATAQNEALVTDNAEESEADGSFASGHLPETLGALLRVLRSEADMTLDQVACAVGVTKPSVWAWENGRAKPTREKWHALAKTFGVAPQILASAAKAEGLNKAAFSLTPFKGKDRSAVLAAGREMIARAYGVTPSAVRITVEI